MSTSNIEVSKLLATTALEISEKSLDSPAGALDELIGRSVQHLPAVDYAGVAVIERSEYAATLTGTHEYPRILDALQQKHRAGPAFALANGCESYYISDLSAERRWPSFCADALVQTPIRSIASFRLLTTRDTVGALTLYADAVGGFDQHTLDLGYIFATHVSSVWGAVQRGEQFRIAIAHRDTIGQAKGMIMERFDVNADQAFDLLRKLSQHNNTRLYDIACQLIEIDHPTSPARTAESNA